MRFLSMNEIRLKLFLFFLRFLLVDSLVALPNGLENAVVFWLQQLVNGAIELVT